MLRLSSLLQRYDRCSMMKKMLLLCFLCALLSSCLSGTGDSGGVIVRVAAFHQGSLVRSSSGRPFINTKGGRHFCRWRPFNAREAREKLMKEGLGEKTLDEYLFIDEAHSEEESSEGRENQEPVYLQVGDNWSKFGLFIQNLTNYFLIIHTVKFEAEANCGSKLFYHSGEFHYTNYCTGEGNTAPYLYIISGRNQVKYDPISSNSFNNLILFIDNFPILDRTGEASPSLQNTFKAFGRGTAGSMTNTNNSVVATTERKCRPNELKVIPRYRVELTLVGYFAVPGREGLEQVDNFEKVVGFSTANL